MLADAARVTTCGIGISHDELLAVHERTQAFLTHLRTLTKRAKSKTVGNSPAALFARWYLPGVSVIKGLLFLP